MSFKKLLVTGFIAIFSLILIINVFGVHPNNSSVESAHETPLGKEIVFFWLPSGVPCQQQNEILSKMEEENSDITINRVDVNNPASSDLMNKYGIRTVPSIVILDEDGKTVNQFTPGIQSQATLKKYLN